MRTTFWRKVEKTDTCWLWTGANARGYGRVKVNGKLYQAHRLVYEALVGPIPDGLQIDHLCRVRNCVNPDHMEPVTQQENMRRGDHYERDKTHCDRGHSFNEQNTRICPDGTRYCRACDRERWHRRKLTSKTSERSTAQWPGYEC